MLTSRMFLAESNKVKRLLHLSYIGHVRKEDLCRSRDEFALLLAELPAGFRLLTDLSHLERMDLACGKEIAWLMEACDHQGISAVARVVPEPEKDIGFKILTAFHYHRQVKVFTCASLEEALGLLLSS